MITNDDQSVSSNNNKVFHECLTPEHVKYNIVAESKKRVLQVASELLVTHLPEVLSQDILDQLIHREKLGSTYIGHGVAIPHARTSEIEFPVAALMHLKTPVDFGNDPHVMVDILFALIVPKDNAEQHLKILSSVAHAFHNTGFRNCLRHAVNNEDLYQKALDYHG